MEYEKTYLVLTARQQIFPLSCFYIGRLCLKRVHEIKMAIGYIGTTSCCLLAPNVRVAVTILIDKRGAVTAASEGET